VSHYIDVINLKEKIFVLNNLALSGESFSTSYCIGVSEHQKHYSDLDYHHFTKSLVSNYAIELAVKLRNASELLQEGNIIFEKEKSIECYNVGNLAENFESKKHDFLYICDKIIHAKKFRIDTVGSKKYDADFKWWNGDLTLSGTAPGKKKLPWEFFFSIKIWCESAIVFLNSNEKHFKLINQQAEDRSVYS